MPLLPLRVGVVTSSGSAAEADLLDELDRCGYAFDVRVADVRVQGPEAATSVAGAITWFSGRDVDVVVVVRGGGATTDLAAFDHELVARAIAASRHPVITGVGHETDRTVADELAHTAAKTPTAAAQHLVGLVALAHQRSEAAFAAIATRADRRLRHLSDHLDRAAARASTAAVSATRSELVRIDGVAGRVGQLAHRRLARAERQTDDVQRRLHGSARRHLDDAEGHLDVLAARVSVADPRRAMARGWSITRRADGTIVRSVADAPAGTVVHTVVADGSIASTVDSTTADDDNGRP